MPHPEWGLLIVVYLFLGGLGAGALVLSALATFVGRQRDYEGIARAGALAAPVPVLLGTGLLVFDLGRPMFFWKLFTAFAPESPMWIGSWLLVLFSLVSLAHASLFVPNLARPEGRAYGLARPEGRAYGLARPEGRAYGLARPEAYVRWWWNTADRLRWWTPAGAPRWRNRLAAAGLPLGIAVGIYTGVLLGAVPARPFWNTPMVAQLFLFSALSTAAALLLLVVPRDEIKMLLAVDVVLILLELLIITPFIVHGQLSPLAARESLTLILGGPFTLVFWVGVVGFGLLVPLAIESWHLAPSLLTGRAVATHRPLDVAVAVLVLTGGFLLRYVFVAAGQLSRFT